MGTEQKDGSAIDLGECRTLDLTQLDLSRLYDALVSSIRQGHVLHGSTVPDLTRLDPQPSFDGYRGDEETAVFGTDVPIIAMARAAAGAGLTHWRTRQMMFEQVEGAKLLETGLIYVLPRAAFEQDRRNRADYLAAEPVPVVGVVHFDARAIHPLFRNPGQFRAALDENQELRPEAVRSIDLQTALLTIRGMLALAGKACIGYYSKPDSDEFVLLDRLHTVINGMRPILGRYQDFRSDQLAGLAHEVWQRFDRFTAGVYDLDDGRIQDQIFRLTRILGPLRCNP